MSNDLFYKAASAFNRITSFGHFPEPEPPFPIEDSPPLSFKNIVSNLGKKSVSTFKQKYLKRSLSNIIQARTSIRDFRTRSITEDQLFYILWAAYAQKQDSVLKVVPSAGGLYPLNFIVLIKSVSTIDQGFYFYCHRNLQLIKSNFALPENINAWFKTTLVDYSKLSALVLIIGNWHKVCSKYGCRGYRYLLLEAGHSAQNMCLVSTSLNIPHLTIGGFEDDIVNKYFNLDPEREGVIYTLALGKY